MATVTFVTSFNERLYNLSGKDLLASWLKHCKFGTMKVFVEGEDIKYVKECNSRISLAPLDDDPWLLNWLEENSRNIPCNLGGTCTREMSMWDQKASLWTRKTAAMQLGYAAAGNNELVIWVDADVMFTKPIPCSLIVNMMRYYDVMYACSRARKEKTGIESGFFVLKKCDRVDPLMKNIKAKYNAMHKDWDSLERHDDGFVMKVVLKEMSGKSFMNQRQRLSSGALCVDIAIRNTSSPLEHCILAPYIVHQKGFHASQGADGVTDADTYNSKKHVSRVKAYKKERSRVRSANA